MHADTQLPEAAERPPLDQQRRLLPALRDALRLRRYSLKTEKAYLHWVKRYIRFHRMRHPKDSLADFLKASGHAPGQTIHAQDTRRTPTVEPNIGAIIQLRPAMIVVVTFTPQEFSWLLTLVAGNQLGACHLSFSQPVRGKHLEGVLLDAEFLTVTVTITTGDWANVPPGAATVSTRCQQSGAGRPAPTPA
ncbi:MAG: phage integrase N-terminal SAM-like domain-containing protein [Burkholderiaceae bacterium]|nr:phage integrase N-terminal SAM-like domain-containing protein [Burkholderiaceae bacterium]